MDYRFFKGRPFFKGMSLICLLALGLAGCDTMGSAYQPNVGPSQTPAVVAQVQKGDAQAALAARQRPQILARYGGEYKDAKTERLVARIEGALTAADENPQQSFRITILNSPTINAFAFPGGYLYVTRGLLGLATDASELAAVLGHEMAHVTQNHGVQREQRAETEEIAGQVVAQLLPDDRVAGLAALARGKMRLAAFSREQEIQADEIGIRTIGEAGFDPYAAADFLTTMQDYNDFLTGGSSSTKAVDFLADHPSTPQRVALARQRAGVFGPQGKVGERGRDYYLSGIDGLLYGPSLSDGLMRGNTMLLPEIGVQFSFPQGFSAENNGGVVQAGGPQDSAIRFDSIADDDIGSLSDYMSSGWVTGLDKASVHAATIRGLDGAVASAAAGKWFFDIFVVRANGHILRFIVATDKRQALEPIATPLRDSVRKMTDSEIRGAKPLRIRIVTAVAGDSAETLAAKMDGVSSPVDIFKIINGLSETDSFQPGQRFKIISSR